MKSEKWKVGNGKYGIKIIFLLLTSYFLLLTSSFAEDTIKVLMLENPDEPLLTEEAQRVGNLDGKVFINGQVYNGSIDVRRDKNGLYFISEIPLEKYVEGVVASESGKHWDVEALKVQAVIARTYATYYKKINAGKDYHLTSTVLHQVYKSENIDPWVALSVKETEGEILTYEGSPIEAFYHSTCGEKTELPQEVWGRSYPYLKSVTCSDKNSPYHKWEKRFSLQKMEKTLGVKDIKDIKIAEFTSTGRVRTIKVFTEDSSTEFKATDLRRLLGYKELPSTLFTIEFTGDEVVFTGKGYGHGVGLCQWCALEMAKDEKTYKEILEYFYPEAMLEKR